MKTTVTLAQQSQEINIIPKEGFKIDLEKSDLKNGKILFKEVEKKYPSEFFYINKRHGGTRFARLSEKYSYKLEILDTLLCIRDEYNRIDGITESFRFGEENWGIINHDNKLVFLELFKQNSLIHFGKEETAELFLKNFKEQLETVKEFL